MATLEKNRASSTKKTIPVVRKILSFFDRILSSTLPDHAVIAEGDDVFTLVPWSNLLRANFAAIHREAESLLQLFDVLPVFGETATVGAGTGYNKKINWRIYPFILMRRQVEGSIPTPVIREVLREIPFVVNVLLSTLPPRTSIAPHHGTSRAVIRCHLGLHIPRQTGKCFFVVDGHKHVWQAGEMFFFDDTYEHYAVNETDEYRSVLIIDSVRGDLPFFWRWFAYGVTYVLGFHPEARRTLRNYRKALRALPP